MSTATAPADGLGGSVAAAAGTSVPGEACPLCGAPLHPEQEWCLRCGAAARTRLAASPNWKGPLLGALLVAVLSLGVLAAALVKLAGDSGPAAAPATTTVTSAAATPPADTAPAPTTPALTTPPPAAGSTSATTPSTPAAPVAPGAASPLKTATTPKAAAPRIGGLSPALSKRLQELSRRQAGKGK